MSSVSVNTLKQKVKSGGCAKLYLQRIESDLSTKFSNKNQK